MLKVRATCILILMLISSTTSFLLLTHIEVSAKIPPSSTNYLIGQTVPKYFSCGARHDTDKSIRITCLDRTNKHYLLIQLDADPVTHLIHETYLYPPRSGSGTLTYYIARHQWGEPDTISHCDGLTMVHFPRDGLTMVHFPNRCWIEFATSIITENTPADIIIYNDMAT